MRLKHPETIAAWAVAVSLIILVASAPWDSLHSSVPPGVVDVAHQRFAVGALEMTEAGPDADMHLEDSRFSAFRPEGL